MKNKKRLILFMMLVLSLSLALTGCGGSSESQPATDTSGASNPLKEGPTIVVSSKDFTENILLGQMTYDYLNYLGYPVKNQTRLGSTNLLRPSLLSKEIDLYWEYDGTVLTIVMQQEPIFDADLCYKTVKEWDEKENKIIWLPKADLNDTFCFAVTKETAQKYKLEKFSDMVKLIKDGQHFKVCASTEYQNREDGLPRIEHVYDFTYPRNDCVSVSMGLSIEALKNGETDLEIAFTTDPRIVLYDLVILEDDMGAFPAYYAAPNVRADLLESYPTLAEDMLALSNAVNTENIKTEIGKIDLDHVPEDQVSIAFLKEKGLIK